MLLEQPLLNKKDALGEITNSFCFEVVPLLLMFRYLRKKNRWLKGDFQAILFCSEVSIYWNVVARQFAYRAIQLNQMDSKLFFEILQVQSNRNFALTHQFWPLMKGTKNLKINIEIGDSFLDIIQWCPNLEVLILEGHQPTLLELQEIPSHKLTSLTMKDGLDIVIGDDPSSVSLPNLLVRYNLMSLIRISR
jgi:hypothetical protein